MIQVDKIQQQVDLYSTKIEQYKSILLADDGQLDNKEQMALNQLNQQIDRINARLAAMKAHQQGGVSLFKRKSKCDRMQEKWQKKIIEPFSQQIEQYQAANAQDLYNYADNLAQQYFDKYSKRRWFNPQKGPTVSDNYLNYIGVFSINRSFEIRRDVQLNEYSEYEELPSTYNGILKQSLRKAIQVGLDDIIEIEVPQSSQYQLILNGQLNYLLDSYDIPDTFILSDNSHTIYSAQLSGTNQKASIPFGQLNGNLKIDVQESKESSVWRATVSIQFLQITFIVPECQEDIPCPEISNPY